MLAVLVRLSAISGCFCSLYSLYHARAARGGSAGRLISPQSVVFPLEKRVNSCNRWIEVWSRKDCSLIPTSAHCTVRRDKFGCHQTVRLSSRPDQSAGPAKSIREPAQLRRLAEKRPSFESLHARDAITHVDKLGKVCVCNAK